MLELFREFRYSLFSQSNTCFCSGPLLILAALGGVATGFVVGCICTAGSFCSAEAISFPAVQIGGDFWRSRSCSTCGAP